MDFEHAVFNKTMNLKRFAETRKY